MHKALGGKVMVAALLAGACVLLAYIGYELSIINHNLVEIGKFLENEEEPR